MWGAHSCSNDEVLLSNESYAFYTSTNTFSNPVFNCSNVSPIHQHHEIEHESHARPPETTISFRNQDEQGTTQERSDKHDTSSSSNSNNSNNNKPSQSASSKIVLLIHQAKEKCAEFCDNFAFSMRDKLFIMETNFKRRKRQLKKFVNKRLRGDTNGRRDKPPPSVAGCLAKRVRERRGFFLAKELDSAATFDCGWRELQRCSQQELSISQTRSGGQRKQQRPLLFNLSEPRSAKALEAQQERILSRLERIKRDNQRLLLLSEQQRRQASEQHDTDGEQQQPAGQYKHGPAWSSCSQFRMSKSASSPMQMTVPIGLRWTNSEPDCGAAATRTSAPVSMNGVRERWIEPAESGSAKSWDEEDAGPKRASLADTTRPELAEEHDNERSSQEASTPAGRRHLSSVLDSQKHAEPNKTRHLEVSPKEKKTCIVCYERLPNIVTLPCEHSDVCSDCFIEIIYMAVKKSQYPLRCVLCRQKVERIRCSRRLMLSVIKRNRANRTSAKYSALLSWSNTSSKRV